MNTKGPWLRPAIRRLISLPGKILAVAATLALIPILAGCESQYKYDVPFIKEDSAFFKADDDTPIVETNYEAAETLGENLSDLLPKGSPIFVTPFTNLEDPTDNSPFGKVVSEEVASALAQEGHKMVFGSPEDKASAMEFLNEYAQSDLPLDSRPVQCVLEGTYVIGNDRIYVTAMIKRLSDNMFVGRNDWTLPLNKNTRQLLPKLRRSGLVPSVHTTAPGAQPGSRPQAPAASGGQFME